MKIMLEGNKDIYLKFMPKLEQISNPELFFTQRGSSVEEKCALCPDAEALLVDAISVVSGELIDRLPKLKLIHSGGVAYNGIDLETARKRGVYVCNNKGGNAGAVAEQAIMLMLELLRSGITGDLAVREGRQIQMKEGLMVEGITELGECSVGLYGFGDIAKATARLLAPFGCRICYYSAHRKSEAEEQEYGVTYLTREELLHKCDIISLHCAVTPETAGMVNAEFLQTMKQGSYLINTARGDLVVNEALRDAIISGHLAGAGLDTVAPEPVMADNPLVAMPEEYKYRIALAPHLGGITTGSFRRMHGNMWNNVKLVSEGKRPNNIVNGL